MKDELKLEAEKIVQEIMLSFYYRRDIDRVLSYLDETTSWIGPGEKEQKFSFSEIQEYFELGKDKIPCCNVLDFNLQTESLSEDSCVTFGSATIRTSKQSHMVIEVNQRLSFVFRLINGKIKAVHMHLSNPYQEMKNEEFFPSKIGAQSYEYLKRLLQEKTEVIDMIASNINGGLKGSNDDDTYSYFYVNEGLPRMLGYTYEEFMEKTGGTAVGAVYPPDLKMALEDCNRCFENGLVYSTEYRMEKKDGSLIWVLDTGRKAKDGEGVTKINSIITDITPLKQTMFELGVERERYRTALSNITDTMYEYDIVQDCFTAYQQVDIDGCAGLEKLDIENFSVQIRDKNMVYPGDDVKLLDICCGRSSGTVEIRTHFFHLGNTWRWNRCRCTVITGTHNEPVKAIGMMKDITEEKEKNIELIKQAQYDGLTHLLNQTAARESIQSYLLSLRAQKEAIDALLIIDLDRFKVINDTKGHLFGNDVLAETAKVLLKTIRTDDIAGRIGGDEFIVLFKNVTKEMVFDRAKRIGKGVEEISGDEKLHISCSIGIVFISECLPEYEKLFKQADAALYQAKNSGRNQYAVYTCG